MCGIVGVRGWTDDAVLSEMLDRIEHRGPDGEGRFRDEDAEVMMGARRLAIIDLENGDQPAYNEDGSVVAVFNGEIYNHEAIRDQLRSEGHRFQSDCDTEVLVHLWEEDGPEMVERLEGMFAFSLWDADTETLVLARDRLGIKPLYYSHGPDGLVWGSEIPALLAAGVDRSLDPAAVYNYFRLEFNLWPRTLLSSVRRLPPGGVATVSSDGIDVRRYWSLSDSDSPSAGSMDQAASRLRSLLEDAVDRRLMADVPVGAFLSGGLDSSAVAGLMAERIDDLETFSVAFPGKPYDESDEARHVADRLGTDHHEVELDPSSLDRLDELVSHMSEPPSHIQFLPILALSRLTREEGVKVALAGEGADELFGGYNRYRSARKGRHLVGRFPRIAYDAADRLSEVTPKGELHLAYVSGLRDRETAMLEHNCGLDCLRPRPGALLDTEHDDESSGLTAEVRSAMEATAGDDLAQSMMTFDIEQRLPNHVLYKTDHTSMAASLEVRVPFLDHRLVEFAHRLPAEYRITPGNEKAVLKRAVSDVVPQRVLERTKHAMGLPYHAWFRTDNENIARWLDEGRLAETPYVDPDRVLSLWDDHRNHRGDYGRSLWTILAFVAWYHSVIATVDAPEPAVTAPEIN